MTRRLLAVSLALLATGCTLGPDYQRPETTTPPTFREIPVYDGHKMRHGNRIAGPAMIEQETTAIFVSDAFDCAVDALGSFALFRKGREDLARSCMKDMKEALV